MAVQAEQVMLSFARQGDGAETFAADLSAVAQVGEQLWLGTDEGTGLARLTRIADNEYGRAESVRLDEVLDLPGPADEEIDIEGLGAAGGYLWVTGSHSRLRSDLEDEHEADLRRRLRQLSRVKRGGNRYLLARVPLTDDGSAARLPGGRRRNLLTDLLRHDEHLGRFLRIPGKDNGFNVEGLAAADDRVLLGLRGPVLRGWAMLVMLAPEEDPADDTALRLARVAGGRRRYAKVFLDLRGLGIRDLAWDGEDLLILAGPTMALRSDALVLRWRGALATREDALVTRESLTPVLDLPYGSGSQESVDHPEGLALLDDGGERSLLVVYDSPGSARRPSRDTVIADRFRLTA